MKKLLSLLLLSPSLLAATGNVVSYDTLDQLLANANPTSVSTELSFKGRNTVNDGGGGTGIFVQDSSPTNLGTVFNSQHPNGSGWQFQRKYDGQTNLRWYGAKGDGSTDDSAALADALKPYASGVGSVDLFIPKGIYKVTQQVTFSNVSTAESLRIVGVGKRGSTISFDNSTGALFYWDDTTQVLYTTIENLMFRQTESTTNWTANCLSFKQATSLTINDCQFAYWGKGDVIRKRAFPNSAGYGISINDCFFNEYKGNVIGVDPTDEFGYTQLAVRGGKASMGTVNSGKGYQGSFFRGHGNVLSFKDMVIENVDRAFTITDRTTNLQVDGVYSEGVKEVWLQVEGFWPDTDINSISVANCNLVIDVVPCFKVVNTGGASGPGIRQFVYESNREGNNAGSVWADFSAMISTPTFNGSAWRINVNHTSYASLEKWLFPATWSLGQVGYARATATMPNREIGYLRTVVDPVAMKGLRVNGVNAQNDGFGGLFYSRNDGGVGPTNALNVFRSTINTNYVWERQDAVGAANDGIINVKDFGAKGTGIDDDTAAIHAAITSGANRTIVFPQGIYICSNIVNTVSNMTWKGEGRAIIRSGNPPDSGTWLYSEVPGFTAENLEFDFNDAHATGFQLTNSVTFRGCKFHGVYQTESGVRTLVSVFDLRGPDVLIDGCEFWDSGNDATGSGVARFIQTQLAAKNIRIANSSFRNVYSSRDGDAIALQSDTQFSATHNIVIEGNTFYDCNKSSIKVQVSGVSITGNSIDAPSGITTAPMRLYANDIVCAGNVINGVDLLTGVSIGSGGATNIVLTGNTVKSANTLGGVNGGIMYSGSDSVVGLIVSDNIIDGFNCGMRFSGPVKNLKISDCIIRNFNATGGYGLYFSASGSSPDGVYINDVLIKDGWRAWFFGTGSTNFVFSDVDANGLRGAILDPQANQNNYRYHRVREEDGIWKDYPSTGMINVKDYGAKGTGTDDDTAAIQAALNAVQAAGGGTVFIPEGEYLCNSTLTLHENTKLIGAGPKGVQDTTKDVTVLRFAENVNGIVLDGTGSYNGPFEIANLKIRGQATSVSGAAITADDFGYSYIHDVAIDTWITGVSASFLIDNTFERVRFQRCYHIAFNLRASPTAPTGVNTTLRFKECYFQQNGTNYVSSANTLPIVFKDTVFESSLKAMDVAAGSSVVLESCYVENIPNTGSAATNAVFSIGFRDPLATTYPTEFSYEDGYVNCQTDSDTVPVFAFDVCRRWSLRDTRIINARKIASTTANTIMGKVSNNTLQSSGGTTAWDLINNTARIEGWLPTINTITDASESGRFSSSLMKIPYSSAHYWAMIPRYTTQPIDLAFNYNSISKSTSDITFTKDPAVQLRMVDTVPAAKASTAVVYAKTNNVDRVELFAMDSLGNETQLTNPAPLVASDTFIYDIPTVSANSMIEFDIAYANAKEGDVFLAYSAAVSKIIVAAACYVDGTVRVGIYNPDSIAINPPPAEFTVKRIR